MPVLSECSLILLNRHILLVPGRPNSSLQEVPDGPRSLNLSIVKCRRRHGRRESRSVHDTKTFLLQQGQQLYAMPLQHLLARHDLACTGATRAIEHSDVANSGDGPSDVCQRGGFLTREKKRRNR
jgi:hypothetical protein